MIDDFAYPDAFPGGPFENSPAIYPWDSRDGFAGESGRDGRNLARHPHNLMAQERDANNKPNRAYTTSGKLIQVKIAVPPSPNSSLRASVAFWFKIPRGHFPIRNSQMRWVYWRKIPSNEYALYFNKHLGPRAGVAFLQSIALAP